MPSHVYHEVHIAYNPFNKSNKDEYWISFGGGLGEILSEKDVIREFQREFTFDTRYTGKVGEVSLAPNNSPVLKTYVSSGGIDYDDNVIYSYETLCGDMSPKEPDGWEAAFSFAGEEGERLAILAMAYALTAEARTRFTIGEWEAA